MSKVLVPHHRNAKCRLVRLLGLVLLMLGVTPSALAQIPEPAVIQRVRQATVFLMQTYEEAGVQVLSCVGSGTLISADGLILTNAHLVTSMGPCRGERIIVALPVRLDDPPVPTYAAELVQADMQFDLAVVRISASLDGSLIDPTTLNLPFVTIGDSSAFVPGNGLTFVGYPDISATSVTAIQGVITGLTAEKNGSRLSWFRTDSNLGGAMSGGGAYDISGRLVGVLTSAPATAGNTPGPMCLSIQDSTRDGLITERDACVPIGAPVTAIRPIVFAQPLIEAARNRFRLVHRPGLPAIEPIAEPAIGRLFFSPQISDLGLPTRITSALPSGATSVYLFFDYDNMPPGIPYEIHVTRDGLDMPVFSLGPLAWGGGRRGTWFVGTEGKTWPDGHYEFTVLLNGQPAASATLTIGGEPDTPAFTDLRFGIPDENGNIAAPAILLPANVPRFDGQFAFEGMREGQDWTEVWYLDGVEIYRATYLWTGEPNGLWSVRAQNSSGLPLGRYRLELYLGTRLAATGDVMLAGGGQSTPIIFSNARLASDISRDGLPAGQVGASGMVMPADITALYAFVDWDLMPTGAIWTYRWFLDGRLVASSTQAWDAGGVGQNFWVGLTSDRPLPEGQYAVEVLVENRPMFSLTTTVGTGTQPLSGTQPEGNEVMITGRVVDALTGEGIPGALVFILDVALESPDFTWNEADIHTQAITDREGRFAFPRGLSRGRYYTAYVFAEGYITKVEDRFTIPRDQPSPTDIVIQMNRP